MYKNDVAWCTVCVLVLQALITAMHTKFMLQYSKQMNKQAIGVADKIRDNRLLCKGKYHDMVDLLFCRSGFGCFAMVKLSRDTLVWLNPNQSNRRSAMH